jgi:large subunit ribosomal protein L5e
LDYEIENNVPIGWINYSIQKTEPNGAWHRLERGEIPLDAKFFEQFNQDFRHQEIWEAFNADQRKKNPKATPSVTPTTLPKVDAEPMFSQMMGAAASPDPHMFPALQKLKASGRFIMGALSNTTIIPPTHELSKRSATEEVKQYFDFFISSAHCGLRKPDPRIYALAMKEMNDAARKKGFPHLEPKDVVFLDDIGINLKFAKVAGMRTIKVNLGKIRDAVKELSEVTGMQLLEDEARL